MQDFYSLQTPFTLSYPYLYSGNRSDYGFHQKSKLQKNVKLEKSQKTLIQLFHPAFFYRLLNQS